MASRKAKRLSTKLLEHVVPLSDAEDAEVAAAVNLQSRGQGMTSRW